MIRIMTKIKILENISDKFNSGLGIGKIYEKSN